LHNSASGVTVHSLSHREGAGERASGWHDSISPLPTSPRWWEGSERLPIYRELLILEDGQNAMAASAYQGVS